MKNSTMKTPNPTPIGNHLRVALKHSALALAVALGLAAGSAQALTTTTVITLGDLGLEAGTPGNGTTVDTSSPLLKIGLGVLPPGSLLRSVALNYRIDGSDPYLGDLAPLFADSNGNNGVLMIAGVPNAEPGYGTYPKTAATRLPWDSGDFYTVGDTGSVTLTAAEGIPAIDLSKYAVWLQTSYTGTWSGSITLKYDVPDLGMGLDTPSNGQSFPNGTSIDATATLFQPTPATGPYTVKFFTKLLPAGSPVEWTPSNVGVVYTAALGVLAPGNYEFYATVTDSATPTAGTATSATSTFTVSPAPPPPPGGVTDLALWLDASKLTGLSDGATVTTWTDKSGLGNNATATGAPIYKTGVLDGQPVIRFDGASRFTTADLSAQFPSAATVFIVTTINNDINYTLVKACPNGVDEWWSYFGTSYPAVFRSERIEAYCAMPNSGSHLFAISSSASAWEMWQNGTSPGARTGPYAYYAGGALVIGNGSSGGGLNGDIAEIMIYSRALTATELNKVGGYLTFKYGLTTAYPPLELSVMLTSPANTQALPYGTSITATAKVTDPGAFTHTVTFHTTPISPAGPTVDTVSANTSSPFSADFGALAAGTYEIYATVLNSNSETATSATRTFTVAAASPTTTVLAAAGPPTTYGQTVTFTATVAPPPTGGTVQFYDGGSPLGSPTTVNTTTGVASYTTTTLGAGTRVITAAYSGYQIYEASTASSISQVVNQAPLTVKALDRFRTVNTANPVSFPYEITGYQNGENLATSGVTGTPTLTTLAVLSSPVGPYTITCAQGSLAASNYSFTLENGTLTIANLACQLGVLNLVANGGINPATGVAWALGDTYRLIFVTSGTTVCTSTDIATYNSFVQVLANAAGLGTSALGPVTWKAVGSTATVDARDNTNTNPSVDGVGVPIVRMDGLFVIANNNADLWDGIYSSNVAGVYRSVHLDENRVERVDEEVRTGSQLDGTADGSRALGGLTNVTVGANFNGANWIYYYNWAATAPGRLYAMSGILTIVSATPAGYGTWANANNATGQTPDQDHDNDGVENGIEYFMGQTGSSFTAMPGLDATNTITWPASAAFTGTYEVQTSPDLATWTNVSPKPTPSGGNLSYLLPTGMGKQFVRLLVTPTP